MKNYSKYFMFAAGAEMFWTLVLLILLPSQIKINFSIILTNGAMFGSRWNILALPVLLFVIAYLYQKFNGWGSKLVDRFLFLLNLLVLFLTVFWLVQLPFLQ